MLLCSCEERVRTPVTTFTFQDKLLKSVIAVGGGVHTFDPQQAPGS